MDDPTATYPVVIEQAVVWGDMDSYQHVNNVVYFRYFENARLEYFRRMGWFEFEQETGIGPILRDTQARFRRPLSYPDTIRIAAHVTDIGEDRMTMEHIIWSCQLDDIVTEGRSTIVSFHYADSRKAALPDELRRRIAELEATTG